MNEWWEPIDQDVVWHQQNDNEYRQHLEEIERDEAMNPEPSLWDVVSEWLKERVSGHDEIFRQ